MGHVKGITIELGLADKTQRKLKAISKHVGALADELEEIGKAIECPYCGSTDVETYFTNDEQLYFRKCDQCHKTFNDELPTHHEGSE